MHIYVDADACPVKEEVYRVARRYALPVTLVANAPRIPGDERFDLVVVREGMDAADIPLAARCVRNGARVIGKIGRAHV